MILLFLWLLCERRGGEKRCSHYFLNFKYIPILLIYFVTIKKLPEINIYYIKSSNLFFCFLKKNKGCTHTLILRKIFRFIVVPIIKLISYCIWKTLEIFNFWVLFLNIKRSNLFSELKVVYCFIFPFFPVTSFWTDGKW